MTAADDQPQEPARPEALPGPARRELAAGVGRRRFLQLAGGSTVAGILAACSTPDAARSVAATRTAATPTPEAASAAPAAAAPPSPAGDAATDFVAGTLPIPPLLAPVLQGGTKVFRLTARQGQSQFVPGRTTATAGYNGSYLGPTLRATKGDRVLVHVTNELGEETTVHWHGMHLPAVMDGGPMQSVADGTTWSPHFTIQQPAATLWYHPHPMGQTLQQVSRGLVGLFILDDQGAASEALPSTYGVDDLPLVLQAQSIGADGQLALNDGGRGRGRGGRGRGGGINLVNGAIEPSISTPSPRLRLRLLNASAQGIYEIGFAGGQAFHQVASDGGLLPKPALLTRLELAPAERAEIVVDLTAGERLVLQSFGGNGGDNRTPAGALLTVDSTRTSGTRPALPASLATIAPLAEASAAQTRDIVLGGDDRNPTINGRSMTSMADMMDLTEALRVQLGSVEVWQLVNRSGDTHAFHVHDIQFQILERDGGPPPANERGLKDTVLVRPRETVRIIMRFTDFADPTTPYMYHCHLLNHEDNGMMGQFLVV